MKFLIIVLSLVIPSFSYGGQEQPTGLNRKQFETILQQFQEIFSPLSQEMGKELLIISYWDIGWELALPIHREEENMNSLMIFGGLARHPLMNEEAFILALCHEMGHFFGGAPYYEKRSRFFLVITGRPSGLFCYCFLHKDLLSPPPTASSHSPTLHGG